MTAIMLRDGLRCSARIILGLAAGLMAANMSLAQNAGPQLAEPDVPITIFTDDAAAHQRGGLADQLLQRARDQGQVRVIVGLRLSMAMEHALSPAAAAQQRQALRTIQDSVATRVLGRVTGTDVVRFAPIPYMSIFVNAGQLARLIADPAVVSIQEDIPSPPLLADSIPLVHGFLLFQMPLLGYAGYLPFGIVCIAVADFVYAPDRAGPTGTGVK